jgi:hypothetical protein
MTLTALLALSARLSIANLQDAYESVRDKLRLPPAAFPVWVTVAFRITDTASLANGSEVQFKQLCTVEGATLSSDDAGEYTVADLAIGTDDPDTFFGFDEADLEAVNDEHETTPEIVWTGADVVLMNLDEAFFWITAYAYPYFVTYSTGPYDEQHWYDIETMADTYGADNLTVDPVLLYPVVCRALAIACQDQGDLAQASNLDHLWTQFVNTYNRNPELVAPDLAGGESQLLESVL